MRRLKLRYREQAPSHMLHLQDLEEVPYNTLSRVIGKSRTRLPVAW